MTKISDECDQYCSKIPLLGYTNDFDCQARQQGWKELLSGRLNSLLTKQVEGP